MSESREASLPKAQGPPKLLQARSVLGSAAEESREQAIHSAENCWDLLVSLITNRHHGRDSEQAFMVFLRQEKEQWGGDWKGRHILEWEAFEQRLKPRSSE